MPSPLQRIAKFSVIAVLGSALVACGGSDAPQVASKAASEGMAEVTNTAEGATGDAAEAVGAVVATAGAPGEPDLAAGEKIYGRFCFSCHAAGLSGAPKTGSAEDWGPRVAKGLDMLVAATVKGVPPAMPAKGLCMSCTEDDLRNTVAWMIAQ